MDTVPIRQGWPACVADGHVVGDGVELRIDRAIDQIVLVATRMTCLFGGMATTGSL